MRKRLAVYSCGRSHGIDLRLTVFPLSSYRLAPIRAPSQHAFHTAFTQQSTKLFLDNANRDNVDKSATPRLVAKPSIRGRRKPMDDYAWPPTNTPKLQTD
jgi:hypothetical protein